MEEAAAARRPRVRLTRIVGPASGGYILAFAVASLLTGPQQVWVGDFAQMVPPVGYAVLCFAVAHQCTGQVRVFWNLNAVDAVMWTAGQAVWTDFDVVKGSVPVISPTDPIFF